MVAPHSLHSLALAKDACVIGIVKLLAVILFYFIFLNDKDVNISFLFTMKGLKAWR